MDDRVLTMGSKYSPTQFWGTWGTKSSPQFLLSRSLAMSLDSAHHSCPDIDPPWSRKRESPNLIGRGCRDSSPDRSHDGLLAGEYFSPRLVFSLCERMAESTRYIIDCLPFSQLLFPTNEPLHLTRRAGPCDKRQAQPEQRS